MREILFRGKDVISGEWVYGDLAQEKHTDNSIKCAIVQTLFTYEVTPSTVGQYTGLVDKNGKQLFDGDIIRTEFSTSIIRFGEYQHVNAQNGYRNGDVGFFVEHIEERQKMSIRNDILYFNEQCEVVGNIYDNPDLLKGENKN